MNTIDEIFELYRTYGSQPYGEAVTIAEHCLQTAAVAKSQGASKELIAAALLHDVGHLIQEADDEYGYHQHDQSGGDYLQPRFGPRHIRTRKNARHRQTIFVHSRARIFRLPLRRFRLHPEETRWTNERTRSPSVRRQAPR